MISGVEPKDQVEIHLHYEGPDVDDGTMSIQDIVPILQGFASAYGKVATNHDPNSTHRLKIVSVRPGSADIVLHAWHVLGDNAASIAAVSVLGQFSYWILTKITGVIQAKRHVRSRPFTDRIDPNGNIIITNIDNVTIEMPLDVYNLFKEHTIDKDLDKLTSPLSEGHINAVEIKVGSSDGEERLERITLDERPYFAVEDVSITETQETWVEARLNSLSKSTNSGWLYLNDGSRVFYRYIGDNTHNLHATFGTYDGLLRIQCVAHMDENFKVSSIDVVAMERMQGELFSDNDKT